jgi:high-affinity nickel-transport protein
MDAAIFLGFVLGLRHAADPDHVIAVSTFLARSRSLSSCSRIALAWGLGHAMMVLLLGSAIIALRIALSPELRFAAEVLVGIMLVGLGTQNLLRLRRDCGEWQRDPMASKDDSHVRSLGRSFGVGLVHGLAGTAGVALLALAAMPTPTRAVAYLAVFGIGTMAGMLTISLGLSVPLGWSRRLPGVERWIVGTSGALALALGLYMVVGSGLRGLRA